MEYKYCLKDNFEDFACGRVIYHKTGVPNFPVRLTQEIYGRCLSYLNNKNDICVYDPCCGGAYLLTILGYLNRDSIQTIIGSDIDLEAIQLGKTNLSLLTKEGLMNRSKQLKELYQKFSKKSHQDAIESSDRLMKMIEETSIEIHTDVFQANILNDEALRNKTFKADIVITDVPYGNLVSWEGSNGNSLDSLLDNLMPILKPHAVVAICSDKLQKIKSNKFKRLEKQLIGKRKFEILTLDDPYKIEV